MKKMFKRILAGLLVAVMLISAAPLAGVADWFSSVASAADNDIYEYNGHYYEVFTDVVSYSYSASSAYHIAEEYCEKIGGHLATITSQEENDAVYSYIKSKKVTSAYFGLSDEEKEGTWIWITGEDSSYRNWSSGEPNSETSTEDYAMFYYKYSTGKWNDGNFGGSTVNGGRNFICEWDSISEIKTQELIVAYESLEYISDATITKSNGSTKIEASGYYTAEFDDNITSSGIMTYAVIPESSDSHISAVHCNGVDALVDAQYVEFPICGDSEEDKNRTVNIYVYTDLEEYKEFQLLYDGTVLERSATGYFSLKANDIPTGHTLKVRVVDKNDKKYGKIDTNIKTYSTTTTAKLADNKISITFPDDLKIIGGWNFDLDLSSLPFFVLKDEDTIKIGVGASESSKYEKLISDVKDGEDDTSYYDKDGTKRALWFDWKEYVKKTKQDILSNTATTVISEKVTDLSKLGCSFVGSELSPVKVDAKAAFYLELKYKDGKWSQVGADGFISISASISASAFLIVFTVPIEFKITGKIGASADASLVYDTENAKWDYSGSVDMTLPSLTGSATIGIPKVFNGGGYVNLTNKMKLTLVNNIKGTLSGELGVQGQFVIFSGSKSLWKFMDWEYLNTDFGNNKKQSAKKKTINISDIGNTDEVFDASAYSLDNRAYLDNQSSWLGGVTVQSGAKKSSAKKSSEKTAAKLLQSSIYQEADPQIVTTDDGTMLMVWTADIAERSTGNQTAVVYSVYDETTGAWSVPKIVYDDGTADAYPDIATDGKDIYIVWVNTKKKFDESVTMEDFAAACEICCAKFSKETGTFINMQTITDNDTFDLMPAVYVDNGEVIVAYTNNSDNIPLRMTGTNTVTAVRITDNSVEKVLQTTVDKPVESLDVSKINGQITAAFTVDEDGNMQTTEDVELYLLTKSNIVSRFTDNNSYERGVQFTKINGENALAYYVDNQIKYTFDLSNLTVIGYENGVNVSPEFLFVDDADGTVMLTKTNMSGSDKANVYANVYDGENWLGDAQITDCVDNLKSFSACKNANGQIQLVYTTAQYETEITQDNGDGSSTGTFTEIVNLYSDAYERNCDIELISVDYDDDAIFPGESLPVTLTVKNNGLTTVNSINLSSVCGSSTDTVVLDVELKPGQTQIVDYNFNVPENLNTLTDVIFSVECDNDCNADNNTQTVKIGYTNLAVSLEKLSSSGFTSAILTISNKSCISTDAKILLHKDSYDGEVIAEYTVLDIPAFGDKTFYLNSDAINGDFDYGDAVCIEVVATKDEKFLGDNQDYLTVDTPETEDWSYTILEDNTIRIDKYNGEATNLLIPETYDDYTVSQLGANAIPESVISVTVSAGLNTVDESAFGSASALKTIVVADENTAFSSKDGILYSKDVTKLIRCPIAYEKESVIIPDTVTSLSTYAFEYCYNLKTIDLKNVTKINSYAFYKSGLTEITIPKDVSYIGRRAFYCNNLITVIYNAIDCEPVSVLYQTFSKSVTNITIGENVKNIPKYMFQYTSIDNIYIPANVYSIGSRAFYNCSKLTSLIFDDKTQITSIGSYAFYGNSELSDISIPESVTAIGGYAFSQCKSLKKINLPNGITTINSGTFYACSALAEIEIPDTVTTIGSNAFYNCTALNYIKLGKNITAIEANSFSECDSLKVGVYKESYALSYAIENSLTYYLIIDEHRCIKCDTIPSTCESDGYTVYSCVDCDFTMNDDIVNKLNHKWNSGITTTEATCTIDGIKTFTCENCDATKTESIAKLEHTDNNGDAICDVCGNSVSDILPGETKTVEITKGSITYLKFVPTISGSYSFTSDSTDDTYGYLYDADKNQITDDDGGSKLNFLITYDLVQGQTYYFGCKYYNSSTSGLFDVTLTLNSVLETLVPEKDTAVIDTSEGYIYGIDPNAEDLSDYFTVQDGYDLMLVESSNGCIGTGTKVIVLSDDVTVANYTIVIFGDVNGDGWYDGTDAITVSCIANGMLTRDQVGEAVWMAADCNHDGVIDQLDVDLLNQAGILLQMVDQTKTAEELLETSAEYVEYLNLIDQNVETDGNLNDSASNETDTNYLDVIISFIKGFVQIIKQLFAIVGKIF